MKGTRVQVSDVEELRLLAEQIHDICRALPGYRGLSNRFSDLVDDSVSDLSIALEDVITRYCQLCFYATDPRCAAPCPSALARYLFKHPERCVETLTALDCWERDHRFWADLCA